MRIGLISDTHNKHGELTIPKELDLLIHAGDLTSRGSPAELQTVNEWFKDLYLPSDRIVVIAGNHDAGLTTDGKHKLNHCTYLQDEEYEVDGIRIYGYPWTPTFGLWSFMVDRETERSKKYIDNIPNGIDILVSHGPAYGLLDRTRDGTKAGCKYLRKSLDRINPKVLVSGHIHEAGHEGSILYKSTMCINASVLDDTYKVTQNCIVIELSKEEK